MAEWFCLIAVCLLGWFFFSPSWCTKAFLWRRHLTVNGCKLAPIFYFKGKNCKLIACGHNKNHFVKAAVSNHCFQWEGKKNKFLRLTFVFFTFISVGSRGIRYESEAFGVSRDGQMAGFVSPPLYKYTVFKKKSSCILK